MQTQSRAHKPRLRPCADTCLVLAAGGLRAPETGAETAVLTDAASPSAVSPSAASEHSARDARGRPASYRDARDRPVRDQGRDVRDGDRGFRLQGRDADPRARRYNNDRDRGYRPPSRYDSAITE